MSQTKSNRVNFSPKEETDWTWDKLNQWVKLSQIKSICVKLVVTKSEMSQIESNCVKLSQIESNWDKLSQIESNWVKSNQVKWNQIKSNQIKSNLKLWTLLLKLLNFKPFCCLSGAFWGLLWLSGAFWCLHFASVKTTKVFKTSFFID